MLLSDTHNTCPLICSAYFVNGQAVQEKAMATKWQTNQA